MSDVPRTHPRYISLQTRERIIEGVESGITSIHGLIAQGRGEAFDYLIGEKTHDFAQVAIEAASALLLLACFPVISVNGNAAALVGKDLVELGKALRSPLEVNIFHSSPKREQAIRKWLMTCGAAEILLPEKDCVLTGIDHNRRFINKKGIYQSDVVFVPLEDGDRCEALRKNEKKAITVDLNPFSRTAKTVDITIVDNVIRAIPLLVGQIYRFKHVKKNELENILKRYNNQFILNKAKKEIRHNLDK